MEKDTQKVILNDKECFTFTAEFKYLGTYFTPKLEENSGISRQIRAATAAFSVMKKHSFILLWILESNLEFMTQQCSTLCCENVNHGP